MAMTKVTISALMLVLRLALLCAQLAVALTLWLGRLVFHGMTILVDAHRLRRRLSASSSAFTCSTCGSDIELQCAQECLHCHWRWFGSRVAPCPHCGAKTEFVPVCPTCSYSSDNPFHLGRELPR